MPAAIVLKRADRKGWSLDRAGGVDSFLAESKALPPDEIDRLRKDAMFLLDCQYSPDPQLRAAAADVLARSMHVKIDPTDKPRERDEQILRASETIFPTTQPAGTASPN